MSVGWFADENQRTFVATAGPFRLVVAYAAGLGGWRAEAHYGNCVRQAPEPFDTHEDAMVVAVELASVWLDSWCNELYELVPHQVIH